MKVSKYFIIIVFFKEIVDFQSVFFLLKKYLIDFDCENSRTKWPLIPHEKKKELHKSDHKSQSNRCTYIEFENYSLFKVG